MRGPRAGRKGSVTTYWCAHRHDRHPHADQPGDLRGEHPAAVDDHLALDVPAVGAHAGDPPVAPWSIAVPGSAARSPPGGAGRRGQRRAQPRRVDLAVGRGVRGARARRRWTSAGTAPAPRRPRAAPAAGPGAAPSRPAGGSPRAAPATTPAAATRTPPSPARSRRLPPPGAGTARRPGVHAGQRRVGAQLPDEPGGVERRPAGQLGALDEQHVPLAALGQVVGDARAADPPPMITTRARTGRRGRGHARHRRGGYPAGVAQPDPASPGRRTPRSRRCSTPCRHRRPDPHRDRPARRAHQPQPQGRHPAATVVVRIPGPGSEPAGHRPRRRVPQHVGRRGRGRRGAGAALTGPGGDHRRVPARAARCPTTTCTRPESSCGSPTRAGGCTPGRGSSASSTCSRYRPATGGSSPSTGSGCRRATTVRPAGRADPGGAAAADRGTVPCHNDLLPEPAGDARRPGR